jgi:hypothetical protein
MEKRNGATDVILYNRPVEKQTFRVFTDATNRIKNIYPA